MKLKLIYFRGCPHVAPLRRLLQDFEKVGRVDFEEVLQDTLLPADPLRGWSSPTLLAGESILFGTRVSGSGCSLEKWNSDELISKINALRINSIT